MLTVYGRKNSSNVQQVLWCCAELGLAYERIDMGRQFGGNKEPAYLALNPMGLVPTIVEDDFVLWESNTIIRYLARAYPEKGLYPSDLRAAMRGERWMDWQLSAIAPAFGPIFHLLVRDSPDHRDPEKVEKARVANVKLFAMLDDYLATSAYLAGDAFSVADIPLGIYAYRWFMFDIDHGPLPNMMRWYERLQERAPFRDHVMVGLA